MGKGLSIAAIIISLIAVSLVGYTFLIEITVPTTEIYSKLEDVYYIENSVAWYPTGTYTEASGMSIEVDVKEGQNLLLMFESEVILRNSGTIETLSVRFSNNGTAILSSVRTVADAPPINTRLSLTTQDNLLNLTASTYTISVESYATGSLGSPLGNRIESCSFVIIVYN